MWFFEIVMCFYFLFKINIEDVMMILTSRRKIICVVINVLNSRTGGMEFGMLFVKVVVVVKDVIFILNVE